MGRQLTLSQKQISLAKRLQQIGYSNRDIADILNIAKSTLWDTLHDRWGRKTEISEWRKIQVAIEVIKIRKQRGLNSLQVAMELDIPLGEVNYIWGTIHIDNRDSVLY